MKEETREFVFKVETADSDEAKLHAIMDLVNHLQQNDQYIEAASYCAEGLNLAESTGNNYFLFQFRRNQGYSLCRLGDYDKALKVFLDGLHLAREKNDNRGMTQMLTSLGGVYTMTQENDKAIPLFEEALGLYQSMENHNEIALVYSNLGSAYGSKANDGTFTDEEKLKMKRRSLDCFTKALDLFPPLASSNSVVPLLMNIGILKIDLGMPEEAMEIFDRAEAAIVNPGEGFLRYRVACGKAKCLNAMDRSAEALEICIAAIGDDVSDSLFNYHRELLFQKSRSLALLGRHKEANDVINDLFFRMQRSNQQTMREKLREQEARFDQERKAHEAEIYRLKNVELAEANRELQEQKATLEQQNAELEQLNRQIREFIGMVVHDLRSPLGAISCNVELMQIDLGRGVWRPDFAAAALEDMSHCAGRINRIATEVLNISAIETGKLTLQFSPVSANDLIKHREDYYRKLAQAKGISYHVETDSTDPMVTVDVNLMEDVLDNLITNAIKFTPRDGQVVVRLKPATDGVVFSVSDTGPGFLSDEVPNVFLVFGRFSAKPTGDEQSTGYGLRIVKKIVDAHGGRINLVSKEGQGSEFRVWVPYEA